MLSWKVGDVALYNTNKTAQYAIMKGGWCGPVQYQQNRTVCYHERWVMWPCTIQTKPHSMLSWKVGNVVLYNTNKTAQYAIMKGGWCGPVQYQQNRTVCYHERWVMWSCTIPTKPHSMLSWKVCTVCGGWEGDAVLYNTNKTAQYAIMKGTVQYQQNRTVCYHERYVQCVVDEKGDAVLYNTNKTAQYAIMKGTVQYQQNSTVCHHERYVQCVVDEKGDAVLYNTNKTAQYAIMKGMYSVWWMRRGMQSCTIPTKPHSMLSWKVCTVCGGWEGWCRPVQYQQNRTVCYHERYCTIPTKQHSLPSWKVCTVCGGWEGGCSPVQYQQNRTVCYHERYVQCVVDEKGDAVLYNTNKTAQYAIMKGTVQYQQNRTVCYHERYYTIPTKPHSLPSWKVCTVCGGWEGWCGPVQYQQNRTVCYHERYCTIPTKLHICYHERYVQCVVDEKGDAVLYNTNKTAQYAIMKGMYSVWWMRRGMQSCTIPTKPHSMLSWKVCTVCGGWEGGCSPVQYQQNRTVCYHERYCTIPTKPHSMLSWKVLYNTNKTAQYAIMKGTVQYQQNCTVCYHERYYTIPTKPHSMLSWKVLYNTNKTAQYAIMKGTIQYQQNSTVCYHERYLLLTSSNYLQKLTTLLCPLQRS